MKIVIFTTMWKRQRITDYTFNRLNEWRKSYSGPNEYSFLAVGSEGSESRDLAERHGFNYVESLNFPLNRKNNVGSRGLKEFNPDGAILIGSDGVYSSNYFDEIVARRKPLTFSGATDFYCLNLDKKLLGYWAGITKYSKRVGQPLGAGRFFGRDVLELCNWELWDDKVEIMQGLDHNCSTKLFSLGVKCESFTLSELNSVIMEIKTDENIWKWGSLSYKRILKGESLIRILNRLRAMEIFADLQDCQKKPVKGKVVKTLEECVRYGEKFSYLVVRDNSSYIMKDGGTIGGRGDVLMASVLAKALKFKHGDKVKVYMKVMPGGEQLLRHNPYVDAVFTDDAQIAAIKPDLRFVANEVEFNLEMEDITKGKRPALNRPSLYLKEIGLNLMNKAPVYIVSEQEDAWAKGELTKLGYDLSKEIISIQITGSNISRTWTRANELAEELKKQGSQVFFLDARREKDPELFRYTIRESAALMKQTKLVVAPNSFYFHLAGAMGHRCVAIFGSVDSDIWVEDYDKTLAVEIACPLYKSKCWWKLACLPGKDMQAQELHDSPECLKQITPELVIKAINKHRAAKKIGILLLTYNCLESTKKTVDSIKSFHDYTLFVSDNNSTDGTQEWFKKQGVKVVSKKMSVTEAQNAGLRMIFDDGDYDYTFILNNDVILKKDYIDVLVETIERNRCSAATGRVFEFPETTEDVFYRMAVKKDEKFMTSMVAGDLSAILFAVDTIKSVGAFDQRFFPRYQEDEDYILRVRLGGGRIVKTEASGFFHFLGTTQRTHPAELAKHTENWERNVEKFADKWKFDPYAQRSTVDNLDTVKRLCPDWESKIYIPLEEK